jgi:predicted DNA-binding ribbon-helix-helix protein
MPATSHQSGLVSHTIYIGKHRTCIRLDHVSWTAVHEVALRERITRSQLFTRILSLKPKDLSFTVAVRQYLVQYFRAAATEDGHAKAGHGSTSVSLRVPALRAA